MTDATKKQRNREYYLKNRERILNRAKARKCRKLGMHLEIVPALIAESATCSAAGKGDSVSSEVRPEKFERISGPEFSCPADVEVGSRNDAFPVGKTEGKLEPTKRCYKNNAISIASEKKAEEVVIGLTEFFSKIPVSFALRLILIAGLLTLMTSMQVAFYLEHDILPGYAFPLALASELAFLSLTTMRFSRILEWLRIAIHVIFFGYFVSALSFYVYAKSKTKAASQPSLTISDATEIRNQLNQAEQALDVATKGRAWKSMEILGAEVSRLRKVRDELPDIEILGTSSDQTFWIEAVLLILLRALLLAVTALNTARLRDQFCEITYWNRP